MDSSDPKVKGISLQIEDIKSMMVQNIDKTLERGERMSLLHDKTLVMSDYAKSFQRRSQIVKRAMCSKNMKFALLGTVLFVILILIIVIVSSLNKK